MKLQIEMPKWMTNSPRMMDWWYDNVDPVNQLLSEGVEVEGYITPDHIVMHEPHGLIKDDNHKALLINIQPIKKGTAEDILHELVNTPESQMFPCNWQERARKVLEKK